MFIDEITDQDILSECKTFRDALRMSWRRSGKTIEQISLCLLPKTASMSDVANMTKNLSRIINPRSPEDKRNLDGDMLVPFMVATGNSIPLRWLFLKYQPVTTTVTVSNDDLLAKMNSLEGVFLTTLRNIHHASKRDRTKRIAVSARMSLSDIIIPGWLLQATVEMDGGYVNV